MENNNVNNVCAYGIPEALNVNTKSDEGTDHADSIYENKSDSLNQVNQIQKYNVPIDRVACSYINTNKIYKNQNKNECENIKCVDESECVNINECINDSVHTYLSNSATVDIVLVDIGATRLMLPNQNMFINVEKKSGQVNGLDGNMSIPIEGEGYTRLFSQFKGLWVPKLKYGLISFSSLFKLGYKLIID